MTTVITNGGTLAGSNFTQQDWIDASSPTNFEIQGYETVSSLFVGSNTHNVQHITFGTGVATVINIFEDASSLVSVSIGPDVTTIDALAMISAALSP